MFNMYRMIYLFTCCFTLLFCPLLVFADEVSTDTNAIASEHTVVRELITDEVATNSNADKEYDEDEIYVESFDAEVLIPYLEDINGLVADIHAEIVPNEISDQGQYSVMSVDGNEVVTFALSSDFGIDSNVIIYEGTWGGVSYRAVFPAEYEKYLIVTDDGYLYNLSGSSVTGRLFQDDVNYEDYEYSSLVLNSVLGNVASTIYNYGYPSYVRRYYVSNNRITNTDTYGLFRVDNIVRTESADPVRIGNSYLLILIMLGGMTLLCFMKKSHH